MDFRSLTEVHFGSLFLRTKSGVHSGEKGVVTSPVAMWIEAVDLLFERIAASEGGKDLLSRVKAISGAGQVCGVTDAGVCRAFELTLLS